jgi:hypothetical protein
MHTHTHMADNIPSGPTSPLRIAPGTWGHKKFKLRNLFGQLSDTDLLYVEGEEAALVARLQARLGKSADEVEALIARL